MSSGRPGGKSAVFGFMSVCKDTAIYLKLSAWWVLVSVKDWLPISTITRGPRANEVSCQLDIALISLRF